jgi:hypothetical protein
MKHPDYELYFARQAGQVRAIADAYPLSPGLDITAAPQPGNDATHGLRGRCYHGGDVLLRQRRLDQNTVSDPRTPSFAVE